MFAGEKTQTQLYPYINTNLLILNKTFTLKVNIQKHVKAPFNTHSIVKLYFHLEQWSKSLKTR